MGDNDLEMESDLSEDAIFDSAIESTEESAASESEIQTDIEIEPEDQPSSLPQSDSENSDPFPIGTLDQDKMNPSTVTLHFKSSSSGDLALTGNKHCKNPKLKLLGGQKNKKKKCPKPPPKKKPACKEATFPVLKLCVDLASDLIEAGELEQAQAAAYVDQCLLDKLTRQNQFTSEQPFVGCAEKVEEGLLFGISEFNFADMNMQACLVANNAFCLQNPVTGLYRPGMECVDTIKNAGFEQSLEKANFLNQCLEEKGILNCRGGLQNPADFKPYTPF